MSISHSSTKSAELTQTRVSRFRADAGQLEEFHVCIEAPPTGSFEEQLASVEASRTVAMVEHGLDENSAVFRRVFLSDAANQQELLSCSVLGQSNTASPLAISVIEQPPLDGRRLSLWEYHVRGKTPLIKRCIPSGVAIDRSGHSHLWTSGLVNDCASGAFAQTEAVLQAYALGLAETGACLRDHAVRTWFYVYDIDADYAALVEARKRHFNSIGLTADTHYIASTGIAGRVASAKCRVSLDAYAVSNLAPTQVKYLSAPQHLGPTHLYGVTFERGTCVAYGDRSHVFISGTASIDPSGKTLHIGDIRLQCQRALENTEALLADAGGGLNDLAQLIAYVRDPADGSLVAEFLNQNCPNVPRVIVKAPVCRPNWLVEIECIASLATHDPRLTEY